MDTLVQEARKRGPVAREDTAQYTLILEKDAAEWGKRQPGGLSDLVRSLLRERIEQAVVRTTEGIK